MLKENNKKQIELTNYLGLSKNVFTEWKAGRNEAYLKYLPKIAEFFNVSVDCLLGQEPKIETNILSQSGNERIKSVINTIINSNIDDNDLKIIEAVLSKYNL